jgi:hypothetical protein
LGSFALDVNAAKQAEERGQRESFHGSEGSWSCAQPGHKGNGLQLEFTVEDDGVFTKPWSAAVSYRAKASGRKWSAPKTPMNTSMDGAPLCRRRTSRISENCRPLIRPVEID